MKKSNMRIGIIAGITAIVLAAVVLTACPTGDPGGGDRTPDQILAAIPEYKEYTAAQWQTWFDENKPGFTEQEIADLSDYILNHLGDLSAGGRQFWLSVIGTDKVPVYDEGQKKIGGVTYIDKDENGNGGIHYRLTATSADVDSTYTAALSAFTTFFGFSPNEGYNLRSGSSLSAGDDWVIFEDDTNSYRLVKSVSGTITGVGWHKR